MAKAGMRRPDPREPHGTESNKKQHYKKMKIHPFLKYKEKLNMVMKKQNK